jgi:DNA-binding NarL/FixJ family response regulator
MRIILADHHVQPCWALRTLLEEQPEFDIIGEPGDAPSLLELAERQLPDLILIDSELPGMNIENLISKLHTQDPRPTVIVMSSNFENSRKLLKAGADAFVSKGDQPEWLLEILYKYNDQIRVGNRK